MRPLAWSTSLLLGLLALPARAADAAAPAARTAVTTAGEADTAVAAGTTPVTLAQLLQMLRDHSPSTAVRQAEVAVAQADVVAAGASPNPTLSYSTLLGVHDPSYVNGTQHLITLAQPLLIGGQRGARRAAAQAGVKAASAQAGAELAAACFEIRKTFVNLLAAQERVTVLTQGLADVERAKGIVAGRAQSGMMSDYDVLKLTLEARSLAARLSAAQADASATSGQLAVQLGVSNLRAQAIGNLETGTPPDNDDRAPAELTRAQQASEAAQARIDVARRERIPTPVLSLGAQLTSSSYTLAAALGVAFDLPIFDSGKGLVAQASAQALQASSELSLTRAQVTSNLARARRALQDKQHALTEFEQDVVSQLPALRRMSEAAYAAGQGSSLDLLDALRTITEAEANHIDYREAAALARVDLLAASGLSASDLP